MILTAVQKQLRWTNGQIDKVREPNKKELDILYNVKFQFPDHADESIKPILVTEGWMSRVEKDYAGDIIDAEAWREGLPNFMKNPAMFFNHDWQLQIGMWFEVDIREEGLYGKNAIYGTRAGQDAALMASAGFVKSYSVGFYPVDYDITKEDDERGWHIHQADLIECSLVSVPMNILATMEDGYDPNKAMVDEAVKKELKLKYFNIPYREKRGFNIVDINKQIDDKVDPLNKRVDAETVRLNELSGKHEKLSKLMTELKDANRDGDKSTGELKTLVDQVADDFLAAKKEMDDAITAAKARKTITLPGVSMDGESIIKMVTKMTPREIKGSVPSISAEQVVNLQRLHDEVIMIDSMLAASSQSTNGNYHRRNREERIKGLNVFKQFDSFAKAMDTATATEGTEWVPTLMSPNLIEQVELELKVASVFDVINMPSPSFEIDTAGAGSYATLAGEKKTVVSAANTVEENWVTGKMTFAAHKARGRYQISTELTEDSAVAIMPFAFKAIRQSIVRTKDRTTINGDLSSGGTSHFYTGLSLGATDFRLAYDGLMYYWYVTMNSSSAGSVAGIDLNTFNEANWGVMRGQMGKYGVSPDDLVHFVSPKTYLMRLLRDFTNFQTLDKYGPNAVVLSGELGRVYNVPNIVTAHLREDLNASGIYDGTTTDRSVALTVNRNMFLRGQRRNLEVLSERDILDDVWQIVAYDRHDFQPTVTPSSSDVILNAGYNIPLSA